MIDEDAKEPDAEDDADEIDGQASGGFDKNNELTKALKDAMVDDSFEHLSQFDPDD